MLQKTEVLKRNNRTVDWNDELDAELRQLVGEGKSRVWIAELYTERFGRSITKNAIVGRCARIGLATSRAHAKANNINARRKQIASSLSPRVKIPGKPKTFKDPVYLDAPPPLLIPLDQNSGCCFVCEGTDDRCVPLQCGHPKEYRDWCGFHARVVYQFDRRAR